MNRFSAYNVYDKFSEILPKGNTEDIENLKLFQRLLDRGHTENEIHLFVSLLVGLESLDAKIVGSDDDISIVPISSSEDKHTAAYFYEKDLYAIYVDNLLSNLKRSVPFVLFDQSYKVFVRNRIKKIPIEDMLIMTSAHEVRHRLQWKRSLPLFSMKNIGSTRFKKLISRYAFYYERMAIPEFKETLRSKGKSEEFIKNKTNEYELDALIITGLVASKLYQGTNLDEIIEIVQLSSGGS